MPTEHLLGNGVRVLAHDLPGQYVALAARRRAHRPVAPSRRQGGRRRDDRAAARRGHRRPRVRGVRRADGAPRDGARRGRLRRWPARRRRRAAAPPRHRARRCVTEALADPVFPDDEVRRILRNRLAEIEQERLVGPPRRRRSSPAPCGTPTTAPAPDRRHPETVGALTRDDLVGVPRDGAWARRVRRSSSAGDLTEVDVVGGARGHPGHVVGPAAPPRAPPVAPVPAPDAARVVRRRPARLGADRDRRRPARTRPVHPDGWAPVPGAVLRARRVARAPASTPCCARRRATPTASAVVPAAGRGRLVRHLRVGALRGTGEAVEILLGILDGARDGFTDAEVRSGVDYVAQDRARPLRHGGCRRRRDRGARPGGAAARLHDAQPARRRRPGRDDLDEAYRRVATGEWSVVLVGTPPPWCRPSRAGSVSR